MSGGQKTPGSERSHPSHFLNLQGFRQPKDKVKTESRIRGESADREVEVSGERVSSMERGEERRTAALSCDEMRRH